MKARWLLLVSLCLAVVVVCVGIILAGYLGKPQFWGLALGSVGFVSLLFDGRITIRAEVRAHEVTVVQRGLLRKSRRTIPRDHIAAVRRVPIAAGYANLTLVLTSDEKIDMTQGLLREEILDIESQVRASMPEPAYR